MFTINRLGLPPRLRRCLGWTNVIDSAHSGVRKKTRRVTNWKNGSMALRWVAAAFVAFVETEKNCRKIIGYDQLWILKTHLDDLQPVAEKESELNSEERRLANFVDFIGEGRGSQALASALVERERRVVALREELEALSRSREKVFQTPPVEWIEDRLSRVKEVLERRTEQSALLLREVLGTIRLEPRKGDVGRPYYLAKTSIDCIALLEAPPGSRSPGRRFEFIATVEAAGVICGPRCARILDRLAVGASWP